MELPDEKYQPLPREAYQALEDIVGADNITEEPAILDSYAFQRNSELIGRPSRFMFRPAAAILPGNTEEVQAIVKTCNRYHMKYKAYSTGWSSYSVPSTEGVLQIDMRRMDRILEIDEQNMFAVVEPYVTGAQLQAEAMKVGLNCHMIGAGCSCAPLASATSFLGNGPDSISMGGGHGDGARFGVGHAYWRCPENGVLGLRCRLVLRRGSRTQRQRAMPGIHRGLRRHGRIYQVRTEVASVARTGGDAGRGCGAGLFLAVFR